MSREIACQDCPLRSASAFAGPAGDQLRFVASFRDRQRHYEARQLVVAEGHADAPLMTIFSGWAFRFRTLSDGRRQILNFLMPGDFIGLQQELDAALTHGVEALTPMTACIFDRKRLWELYREHPALAYDLTWLCAHEELIVDENLLSVGQRSAQERIAMLLIHLYKRGAGLGLCEAGTLTLPLGQQHIADALGLSLVHTNKTLQRLRAAGLVALEGNRLRIGRLDDLQRLADYYALPVRTRPLI
ncbi:MAG: Crp/Fnr family transcriptional regulator [Rhodocyclaceae bacterium]|nr:Crp/Fnr family transcriptional regulator [Rhodocyclaceae bacterium]